MLFEGELADPFRSFISKSRYARYIDEWGRRETWTETVDRYCDYFAAKVDLTPDEKASLRWNIKNQRVMPSMRSLMTAGEALERSNIAGYNCSAVAVNDPRVFSETLYVLLNGTGLGFSVESRYVNKLPEIPQLVKSDEVIQVEDSKEGWALSYQLLIDGLYRGEICDWDLTQLRPEGARLKTFGGRSSGPEPLDKLFNFTVDIFKKAAGRRINTLEAHEIMCMIGSVVVVGGVRRSALISLSDLSDELIRDAKSGEWWDGKPHLALSNNSAVYRRKPSKKKFDEEWNALRLSGSGERGIFNLGEIDNQNPERRKEGKANLTNPCGEILLRNMEFCNLSEVIVRPDDTLDDLKEKISLATKIGTWQSTLTNFPVLREEWRSNAEEERLLGVSLTGQMGHKVLNGSAGEKELIRWLKELKKTALSVNKKEAKRLGINPSASITCVKPSGTVSLLTGVSSGMHAWHSEYYIRSVRVDTKDPICDFMKDAGVPHEIDFYNPKATVFYFPFEAPAAALTRNDMSAIDQVKMWLTYKKYYTEHNPSVTVSVKEEEWDAVRDFVYENWENVGGLSFLPHSDHTYKQAPYQECSKEEYEELAKKMPDKMDWSRLPLYEFSDRTTGTQELACSAGVCEIADVTSK